MSRDRFAPLCQPGLLGLRLAGATTRESAIWATGSFFAKHPSSSKESACAIPLVSLLTKLDHDDLRNDADMCEGLALTQVGVANGRRNGPPSLNPERIAIVATSARILVKLRPGAALAAADPRANLRPLHETAPASGGLALSSTAAWYIADLPDAAQSPWDTAHAQVADQLGIDESSIMFAEPDLPQTIYRDEGTEGAAAPGIPIGSNCGPIPQDAGGQRATGPHDGWHLDEIYSELDAARAAVQFSDRRTRIAHIDTGYDREHVVRPARILSDLERNFVDGDDNPTSALDPNRNHVFDNSGHGTGTIGILAGGQVAALNGVVLGGAPEADVLPLRVANRVVLFYTSVLAQAFRYAVEQQCDVVTLSMGGLPSRAWNDAVNEAYEAGLCIAAASGNNLGGAPTRHVVYPARYHRVIAACGVMANRMPYDDLAKTVLEGNWGPQSCMTAALAAYTPNVPWPVFGCRTTVRMNGEGTSSATPQVAAAVGLWFEKYKSVLPRDWRRIEAVRYALFTSASPGDPDRMGRGTLRARRALDVAPALGLPKTPPDSDSFAFLRVLTGLGVTDVPAREAMLNLELAQRWLQNPDLQKLVPDPEASRELPADTVRAVMDAVIQDPAASLTLRKHLAGRYPLVTGAPAKGVPPEVVPAPRPACGPNIAPGTPPFRLVRTYAVDPSFSTRLDTASINEVTLKVKWEDELKPGPVGEYLEVVDEDAIGTKYPPVDLNASSLLAQNGWAPSEGNAAFHQQMVYAIAMKTIEHFEHALGRRVLWRPRIDPQRPSDDSQFVRQLRVEPHALHQANAYYSPEKLALLFGYFEASADDPGDHVPRSTVYGCLSHDIVAHETTHAILDGMHRHFNEPSNIDVLAIHEAFADIVALMQHFTIPEILLGEIGKTRGDLEAESILGSLAIQFGRAMGARGALRDAIGRVDDKGNWTRDRPDPEAYHRIVTPHARGAILVAAVFDAFIAIYKSRIADLLRISTGGTGVLPSGAIHPDLVRRLADEASKSAQHVLNMCIRALDYVPPVDITFGEYLRGIITADFDLVPDDRYDYRVAFVEAFRRRGIYPRDLDTISVDTLRWSGAAFATPPRHYRIVLHQLKRYADACFYMNDRKLLFDKTREQRELLKTKLMKVFAATPGFAGDLGLDSTLDFEVHELRRAIRLSPDGRHIPQIVAALTQSRPMTIEGSAGPHVFRGGSTLIVDLSKPDITYRIVKRIDSNTRFKRTQAFLTETLRDPLRALFVAPSRGEPFAALHALAGMGDS
jgi:hypothetical protein